MDDKLWNFATTITGGTGLGAIVLLAAWRLGVFKWAGTFMAGRISNEAVVKANNEVNAEIIKRLKDDIAEHKKDLKDLKESHSKEIKELKDEHRKEIEEKKKTIAEFETQHDVLVAQLREAKRNLAYNEADLLNENKKLRQQVMELETELAKIRSELDSLKNNNDYNPISAD